VNVAVALLNLSNLDILEGDYLAARRHAEEALVTAREVDAAHVMTFITSGPHLALGDIALLESDYQAALQHYVEALEDAIETDEGHLILCALEGIAFAAAKSDVGAAIRIDGATRTIRASRGTQLPPVGADSYAERFDRLRELAGKERFDAELAAGTDLSLDQTIELARRLSLGLPEG
jgi:hypothetical protein